MRWLFVYFCVFSQSYSFYNKGMQSFIFFTNWALITTAIYMIVSINALRPKSSTSLLALHHILFSFSLVMNIVVVSVYWPFLFKTDINRPETKASWFRFINCILTHSVPLLASYYNYKTIYAVMKRSHCVSVIPLVTIYLFTNYRARWARGEPLYWFLTWEDKTSVAVVVLIYAATILLFN